MRKLELTHEQLGEFKSIYKEITGVDLSDEQATDVGVRFLKFVYVISGLEKLERDADEIPLERAARKRRKTRRQAMQRQTRMVLRQKAPKPETYQSKESLAG